MAAKNRCSLEAEWPDRTLAFRGEIWDTDPKIAVSEPGTLGCTSWGNLLQGGPAPAQAPFIKQWCQERTKSLWSNTFILFISGEPSDTIFFLSFPPPPPAPHKVKRATWTMFFLLCWHFWSMLKISSAPATLLIALCHYPPVAESQPICMINLDTYKYSS